MLMWSLEALEKHGFGAQDAVSPKSSDSAAAPRCLRCELSFCYWSLKFEPFIVRGPIGQINGPWNVVYSM